MRGLVLLAVLVLVALVARPLLRAWLERRPAGAPPLRDELVKDPVCQTYILASRAVTAEADGVVTRFCSPECAARFARGEPRA